MELLLLFIAIPFVIFAFHRYFSRNSKDDHEGDAHLGGHGERCITTSTAGENELMDILSQNLNTQDYYIFNNLIVPNSYGKTTEIDHVVISDHGIFIIENKDYQGYIFGDTYQKQWTQCLRGKNGKSHKTKFKNPIHQNYGHIKSLQSFLPFVHENKFYSIVAFSRRGDFKSDIPKNVFYYDQITDFIEGEKGLTISLQRVLMTIGKLSKVCQLPPASRVQHINSLRK